MSEYIHFSWHASTPLWAGDRRLERGHPHVKKINVFDKREQRKLACYAEVRRKKAKGQLTNEARAETELARAMPCKKEEDEVN